GPGARLEVGTATSQPALPVGPERLLGVADLAALDLLDQPPTGVPRGPLAGEAALCRLCSVGAPIDEPPASPAGGGVGVDAAAATMAHGVGATSARSDLREGLVECASCGFGGQAAGPLTPVRV